MKVVDASVVAKWFFEEEGTKAALVLRDLHLNEKERLAAPDLLLLEFANLLLKKRRHVEAGVARDNLRHLVDLGIDIYPVTSDLALRALEISQQLGITSYDGAYIALAEALKSACITADKSLAKAAKSAIKVE